MLMDCNGWRVEQRVIARKGSGLEVTVWIQAQSGYSLVAVVGKVVDASATLEYRRVPSYRL